MILLLHGFHNSIVRFKTRELLEIFMSFYMNLLVKVIESSSLDCLEVVIKAIQLLSRE